MTTRSATLVDATTLSDWLQQGTCIVLDCRFSLADPTLGEKQYSEGHLPGARYAHLDHDLSSKIVKDQTGRHPLPDPDAFVRRLSEWGVDTDTQIVTYDASGSPFAARAWWLCQWVGHQHAAVLDGGIKAWIEHRLPLSLERPAAASGRLRRAQPRVSSVEVSEVLEPQRLLVDARDRDRFTGRHEPLDPVAGHIPGALNMPYTDNLDENGRFLTATRLAERFQTLQRMAEGRTITHYCGSGVTAAHNILAMHIAGYQNVALYAGSWSEWVQNPERPVATGVAG